MLPTYSSINSSFSDGGRWGSRNEGQKRDGDAWYKSKFQKSVNNAELRIQLIMYLCDKSGHTCIILT